VFEVATILEAEEAIALWMSFQMAPETVGDVLAQLQHARVAIL